MRVATAFRILRRDLLQPSLREHSWEWRLRRKRFFRSLGLTGFRQHVLRDRLRFLMRSVRPIRGENEKRAHAAVDWLLRAQEASPDDGVALGYFPCHHSQRGGWLPSYPETTGYIVQSLLEYARRFERPDVRKCALAMSEWERQVQMPCGAVQAGPVSTSEEQQPAVFNTGMVLQGWTAVLAEERDAAVEASARKAADFLVGDLAADGHFRTHGPHGTPARIKTYTSLCAWALHRFGDLLDEEEYRTAAVRNVEAAIGLQSDRGWFAENCLSYPDRPLTHTIGYTLQGVLEVGLLAGREDIVVAARRGTDPILERIRPSGFLHGRFFSDWEPGSFSSCLTGSAQIAVVCFRLHEVTSEPRYLEAGNRLIDYLKGLQALDDCTPEIRGAIGGSQPLTASYMTYGFPNWATKYFLDALLMQERLAGES